MLISGDLEHGLSAVSATLPQADCKRAASDAGLRHVSDRLPGYRRRRRGRGFSYHDWQGHLVRDKALRDWIRALAIPPAWRDVWISPYRDGHLLATGRDEKGRKQYIYHPRWQRLRTETAFHQLLTFGEALPALRAQVDADLRQRGLPRERVLALVVHLLDETLIRIGNTEYAEQNRSYGLTTLQERHLELEGARVHFEFRGKSGKRHVVDIRDHRIARILRQCQELRGQELFQYLDAAGQRHSVDSADVNDYLSRVTGQPFTAKVFRTWGGSVTAVQSLLVTTPPETPADAECKLRVAIRAVAQRLRNTPAVCRRHYVHPAIIARYRAGTFVTMQPEPDDSGHWSGLDLVERALMRMLREA